MGKNQFYNQHKENLQNDLKFSVHQSQQQITDSINNFTKKIQEHDKIYDLMDEVKLSLQIEIDK